MKVDIIEEAGHEWALYGMALSYKDRKLNPEDWWPSQRAKAEKRAVILAGKDGGHNKFLESICVWLDIEAPRAWWSEMDTYRVGTTKQSESTMHTLSKRPPERDDFEEGTDDYQIQGFIVLWEQVKSDIHRLKMNLPEGFLQRRVICTNSKVLRNLIWQRDGHRLKLWQTFIDEVLVQAEHPEYLK